MPVPASFPRPVATLPADPHALETVPLVSPSGFREYDARWWLGRPGSAVPPELNLMGATALGLGLGPLLHELDLPPGIAVFRDTRAYSAPVKLALVAGLMAAGAAVRDIGLALSPMAYFAQFALDLPAVAMVTASHNENGWTGVKMGAGRPFTFGPAEMARLKEIVLSGAFRFSDGGSYGYVDGFADRYVADLTGRPPFATPIKAVVATGNGTAGVFAPRVLAALGSTVVPLDTQLDATFPRHNPNPEDLAMLAALAEAVTAAGADVGFAFDGDGDRCGVVDDRGRAIYADKVGVLIARALAARHANSRFVVDVKSTGLFAADPELARLGATVEYGKTGHSYMKRRVAGTGAVAGFEKSGHFFFAPPVGRGYDDGLLAAIAVCDLLGRHPGRPLSQLYDALPVTFGSPTMAAHCPDAEKYAVAEAVSRRFAAMRAAGEAVAGHRIADLVTINGVRVVTDDGTWGLVRASSNKPELVVVVESPVSEARMRAMFAAIDAVSRENAGVGPYNQTI